MKYVYFIGGGLLAWYVLKPASFKEYMAKLKGKTVDTRPPATDTSNRSYDEMSLDELMNIDVSTEPVPTDGCGCN